MNAGRTALARRGAWRRSIRRGVLALGLGAVAMAASAAPAIAEPFLDPEQFMLTDFITDTTDYTAGAHPTVRTAFDLKTGTTDTGVFPYGRVRRVEVDLPFGLVGNPTNFPKCPVEEFFRATGCPVATQVGVGTLAATSVTLDPDVPISMLESGPDEPVLLGIKPLGFVYGFIRIKVRPDGGLTAISDEIPIAHPLYKVDLTLWGVPADHNGSGAPRLPFMTAPTQCRRIDPTVVRAYSYEGKVSTMTHSLERGAERCDELKFEPTITATPTERATAVPTGLEVQIKVPQDNWPDGRATAHVESVRVQLPEGMSVSPSSANGLAACSPAQFGYRTDSTITCPDASKIGTVAIKTPLLEEPMTGSVFLAKQNENPFNSLLALYVSVQGAGQTIKLAGRVDPDPVTGRLTTSFRDNPQLPFEQFDLRFKSGPRAPLVTPQTCGTYNTETTVTSWSDKAVSASTPLTIDQNCVPIGFKPTFSAGSVSPVGGSSSTFSLTFGRGDHDQELRDITVAMPEGLTGKIASAQLCADVLAAAGGCGEGSRIGSVTSSAGPGSGPIFLPGRANITGPYKGAPFGLSIVVPAVAGPFDLGNVIVRAGIYVDRRNASLRVVSDPMPRILQGIPLHVRSVNVSIDKPGFMLNPTSCAAKTLVGRITSQQNTGADVSSRFQVGGCGSLPIRQKMSLSAGAVGKTGREKRTPFTAKLTQMPGLGNLKSVEVVLPKTLNGRLDVIQRDRACTIAQFEADRCPNVIGEGVATTPLLRDPLKGRAYFVYNPARKLPDIVVRLRGQVDIDLVGRVTIPRDLSLRTTFDTVPDVPVSSFKLRLLSGATNGPIGVVSNLCTREGRKGRARITMIGHNGRRVDVRQKLRINGCGRRAPTGRAQSRRASSRRAQARRSAARSKQAAAR